MAMNPLRIRYALRMTSSFLRHTRTPAQALPCPVPVSVHRIHSTHPVSLSSSNRSFNNIDVVDPDTILFEGCDYKHWLIVMDFGKDPNQRPPPDQMVDTYVQTCAKVLGSVEEAKKRIYACSTTTYTGFQVLVDEDISKKFEGLPGVIFVLPDSYIDPVNKEYGGDKYNNGEIIPRPPPVQYGRTRRPAGQTDQRPRFPAPNQQGNPTYNQQGNPAYNQRAPALGDGRGYAPQGPQLGFQPQQSIQPQQNHPPKQNFGSSTPTPAYPGNSVPLGSQQGFQQQQAIPLQQNYQPKQNYGLSSPAPTYTGNFMPSGTNHPGVGMDGYQSGSNFVAPQRGNYSQGYNHPQGQTNNHPENIGGYASPPGQFRSESGNYGHNLPQGQGVHRPGERGGYAPPGQMGFSGDTRVNSPPSGIGGSEQRRGGSFEQSGSGQYGQAPGGNYSQNAGARYPPHGGNQMFPPTSNEQIDPMQRR